MDADRCARARAEASTAKGHGMAEDVVEHEPGTSSPRAVGKTIDAASQALPVPARAHPGAQDVLFCVARRYRSGSDLA